MEAFITYLAKAAAGTGAFYLFYLLLFRHSKQFGFLRVYLLASMAVSYVLPLITITRTRPATGAAALGLLPETAVPEAAASAVSGLQFTTVLAVIFAAGLFIATVNFVVANLRVLQLLRDSRPEQVDRVWCLVSDADIHPFSYFNRIVLPARLLQSPHVSDVLLHEQIHLNERHTIDVFVAEILLLFQWFNPFARLMRDAVKNNIEFLTDDQVIRRTDRQRYQMAMVALAGTPGIAPFLIALNGSQLKSRIMMMKKKTTTDKQLLRKLLIVPVLTVLVVTLSNKPFEAAPLPARTNHPAANQLPVAAPADTAARILPAGAAKPLFLVDGKKVENIENIDPMKIESITVYKQENAVAKYGEQGKNGVVEITMKKKTEQAAALQPAVVKTDSTEVVTIRPTGQKAGSGRPLIVVDGVVKGNIDVESLDISPDDIESINILKDKASVDIYGEKGKDGVILITTKK